MSNSNPQKPQNRADDVQPTQNIATEADIVDAAANMPPGMMTSELLLVSFYLPGRSEPIIVNGSTAITIGRRDPKRHINPTIDLTEDHGAKLGVSRMHAEMNFLNGKYYVKDTGSSNGTWVNDTKLQPYQPHPVMTGDQVRIGQLAIVVHLSLPQRDSTTENIATNIDPYADVNTHTYRISDSTGGILVENGIMVISKLRGLSTFLERVSRIHSIIREAQERDATTFSVKSIRVRTIDDALVVDISEGKEIMDFFATKLGDFLIVIEGKTTGNKKQTDSLQRYSEPLEQVADYALQEMVFRFLNEARDDYVKKLAPHFDAILSMEFTVERTTN